MDPVEFGDIGEIDDQAVRTLPAAQGPRKEQAGSVRIAGGVASDLADPNTEWREGRPEGGRDHLPEYQSVPPPIATRAPTPNQTPQGLLSA